MSTALTYPIHLSPSRGSMPIDGRPKKQKRMFNNNHGAAALERFETGATSPTMAGRNSDGMFDVSRS